MNHDDGDDDDDHHGLNPPPFSCGDKVMSSPDSDPHLALASSSLTPLKTVLELRAGNSVVDVYITIVPVKSANTVLT
jgi:hypothetical protein